MDIFTLVLATSGKEDQALELNSRRYESSIADTAKPVNFVFNNLKYSGRLLSGNSQAIGNFQLFINDQFVESQYQQTDGTFSIKDTAFGDRPFAECYGYVQLTVKFTFADTAYVLDTDYIPVMFQKNEQNESVRRMAKYVHSNNGLILFANADFKQSDKKNIESRILLLREIGQVFERHYAYFKVNSRFAMVTCEYTERFEKLRYISPKTLGHIIQHPSELRLSGASTGIQVGKYNYLPERTLITNNIKTFDIYENQEIIGFLDTVLGDINKLVSDIQSLIPNFSQAPVENGDYVKSDYFIYEYTVAALKTALSDLNELRGTFILLLTSYKAVYNIKGNLVAAPSKPTAIFMSIPQYRQIYDCMVAWFEMDVCNLAKEQYMLSFLKISTLYEIYVLLKILKHFEATAYNLIKSERIQYYFSGKTFYKNTRCKNLFVFEGNDRTISVYYQPVIYSTDHSSRTGIGLYRNTTISVPESPDQEKTGEYYTPDFLLKIENTALSTKRYVILDAKFSTVKNVKSYQVSALAYKYLFSISPIDQGDAISGLLIINGQSQSDNDELTDIYDRRLEPNIIIPYAEILTLTENSMDNDESHKRLLNNVLAKYL